MNNSFNDAFTVEGVTRDLRWRNVAATATLGVIPNGFRDLEVSFPNASIDLGNRVITLSGNIGLYAGVDVAILRRTRLPILLSPRRQTQISATMALK